MWAQWHFTDMLLKPDCHQITLTLKLAGVWDLQCEFLESQNRNPDFFQDLKMELRLVWIYLEPIFKWILQNVSRKKDTGDIQSQLLYSGQFHWTDEAVLTDDQLLETL